MIPYTLDYYEEISEISEKDESEILSVVELEENYIALCTEEIIKIYYYNEAAIIYKYKVYMTIDEGEKYLSYLLYTKDKKLIAQTEKQMKIYDIDLKHKKYNLLQTLKLGNYFTNLIELPNGDIVTNTIKYLVYVEKINTNSKLYEIKTKSQLGRNSIEYIIKCNKNEICASSGQDELIGFFNIKTLKCTLFKHPVSGGLGVLCMINKDIMFIISAYGKGFSLVNIKKYELIYNYEVENRIFHYAIKLSDNNILLASQKEWTKCEKLPFLGYKYTAFREPSCIKLKHLFYDEENSEFKNYGNLEIKHYEILNVLIYMKNKHIVTCSRKYYVSGNVPLYHVENVKIYELKINEEKDAKKFFEKVSNNENSVDLDKFKAILKNISYEYKIEEECDEETAVCIFNNFKNDDDKISFENFKILFKNLWDIKFNRK